MSATTVTRSGRVARKPLTYWEEYVETDEWYCRELVADVPPDELYAAMVDVNFQDDYEEDAGDIGDEGGDGESLPDSVSDDASYVDADSAGDASDDGSDGDSSAEQSGEETEADEGL